MVNDKGQMPGSDFNWPDPDVADELMEVVLQHFVTHHKVVFKKLHHAQEATIKSVQEIEEQTAHLDHGPDVDMLAGVKRYEQMWAQIIEMFKAHGATQDDLDRIEDILVRIPRTIKKFYDELVEQDKALKSMITSLNSIEYQKALDIIQKVQSQPNPMSGLLSEEYDATPPVTEALTSYEINPHILNSSD